MKQKLITIFIIIFILSFSICIYIVMQSLVEETPVSQEPKVTPVKKKNNKSNDNKAEVAVVNNQDIKAAEVAPVREKFQDKSKPVVDQTLKMAPPKVEKVEKEIVIPKPIVKEEIKITKKYEVEFTLIDGETNKVLTNYEVTVKSKWNNQPEKIEAFNSDKLGSFIYSCLSPEHINFQILTKDFSIHSISLNVQTGRNYYRAKLKKGGSIEIRATNIEGKVIESVEAKMGRNGDWTQNSFVLPLLFNAGKGSYMLSNLPLGFQEISFKAPSYQESIIYKVMVETNNFTVLEVKLAHAKRITFDLLVKSKPDSIKILNFKNDRKRSVNAPEENLRHADEMAEVVKNQKGLYEYDLLNNNTSITIWAAPYAAKEVTLISNIDQYQVALEDGIVGKVQLNDESGKAIAGANISCMSGSVSQNFISGVDGAVLLTGLIQPSAYLIITHPDFMQCNIDFRFDAKEIKPKEVVLKAFNGLSGKVQCNGKPVAGANVFLLLVGNTIPILRTETTEDGNYSFTNLEWKKDGVYFIKTNHLNYGHAKSANFFMDGKPQIVDLSLVSAKSMNLKLVDNRGAALPGKTINITSIDDNQFRLRVTTNEKGQYECLNFPPGVYLINLEDDNLKVQKSITVPTGNITLTAEPKARKKINVTVEGGKPFIGSLRASVVSGLNNNTSIEVIILENGFTYLDFSNDNISKFGPFLFEAQGYAPIQYGPIGRKPEEMPAEFAIEFKEGETLRVKVEDERNNNAIPFTSVELYSGKIRIQSLPTSQLGVVVFNHLIGKYTLCVKEQNYATFTKDFDCSQTKEMLVKLSKGGGVKGHLTKDEDLQSNSILLRPGNNTLRLQDDGNFEFHNLTPGEYILSVQQISKDGKVHEYKIPNRVVIENEKILELNLDDNQKK